MATVVVVMVGNSTSTTIEISNPVLGTAVFLADHLPWTTARWHDLSPSLSQHHLRFQVSGSVSKLRAMVRILTAE